MSMRERERVGGGGGGDGCQFSIVGNGIYMMMINYTPDGYRASY